MATTYSVGESARFAPVREKQFDANLVIAITPTTLALNDIYKFCFIPANSMLVGIGIDFSAGAWDTNVAPTLTLSLGDSGSATRFLNASTVGQGTSAAIGTGIPRFYTADDQLQLKLNAAAATASFTVARLFVSFVLDGYSHS